MKACYQALWERVNYRLQDIKDYCGVDNYPGNKLFYAAPYVSFR